MLGVRLIMKETDRSSYSVCAWGKSRTFERKSTAAWRTGNLQVMAFLSQREAVEKNSRLCQTIVESAILNWMKKRHSYPQVGKQTLMTWAYYEKRPLGHVYLAMH